MAKDPTKQIICPIILFIEGIAIDSNGRKSLEPLSLSWKVLGYIPNIEKALKIDYKYEYSTQKSIMKKNRKWYVKK